MRLVVIGVAGAAGALCRLGVSNLLGERSLPLATMAVNVVGSLALGLVLSLATSRLSPEVASALAVGFLGAFTTFSTFTAEVVALQEAGRVAAAAGYVVVSVALGLAAAVAGQSLGRSLS